MNHSAPTNSGEPPRQLVPVGLRYMALAALFFSLMSLLVKIAGRRLPSQEVVFARALVSLLLSWLAVRRAGISPWGERRKLLALRGLLGFGALSCFYYGLIHLPLADATVIQYTNPIFAAVLAALFLREHIGALEAATVLLSLVGVALVARPSFVFGGVSELPPFVVAVALLGAILSGAAYVTVRGLARSEETMVIVFYFALISVIGSAPSLLDAVVPTARELLVLLGVGITTQLGQIYLTRGLRRERAGRATAVGYLQIVFAAIWGALLLGEVPDGWTFAGATVIIGATLLLARVRPPAVAGT